MPNSKQAFFSPLITLPSYLDSETKHADDTVHALVFPPQSTASIGRVIPVAGTGGVQSCSVLLHNHRSDNVLERSAQFGQLVQALLDDVGSPLVDFVVLVRVPSDRVLDGLLDDVADVVHNEGSLFRSLEIVHDLFIMVRLSVGKLNFIGILFLFK